MTSRGAEWRGPKRAPRNWPAIVMFAVTTAAAFTIFPWYAVTYGFAPVTWLVFVLFMLATGMSITGGYHRLWSHRAYAAHPIVEWFYLLFGAMALQNSVFCWAAQHRFHHRFIDDVDNDPYAIGRGFWFAHIGWMLRDYPGARVGDFSNIEDLQRNPRLRFQHRHYLAIALGMNVAAPLLAGWLVGDVWGCLLLAGLLRLVLNHHFTFFINSLAHLWGRRPYTRDNTARDNDLVALITYGEGYHNFHHQFQWDYRNGVRWWQFDPTKWLIASLSWVRLTYGLKRVPEFRIQRAMLARQFERLQQSIEQRRRQGRLVALTALIEQERVMFAATLGEFRQLQAERFDAVRRQLADQWRGSEVRERLQALEKALRAQRRRVRLLRLQVA
ncbi:MAG: acyl-CoA desaturase [Nevskiaceae bacterium]|nr:MAG: acyl-CoA desaturase [Nevskiaceae bacterium]TBR73074.1 MAG: acyl-CoA desaturase [Nevskiaceae bacterium]